MYKKEMLGAYLLLKTLYLEFSNVSILSICFK